jgi:3'(2'), 5'-bisphosphate nucleotidase
MPTHTQKIFGIGLSKTGTTSLARALETLGYRTRDYLGVTRYIAGDLSSVDLEKVDTNDAFTDTPIPSFYKELDKHYPNSKFILTTRDMDGWLKSCKKQFTERIVARQNEATAKVHTDLYGCFAFEPDKYASGYTRYVAGVLDYFKDRPQDLLVVDICGGEQNWVELCTFLERPVPDIAFPVTNVSAIQWMNIQNIVSLARQAGQQVNKLYRKDPRHRHTSPDTGQTNRLRAGLSGIFSLYRNPGQQNSARLQKAIKISNQIIIDGLKKMNPAIPIITPENTDIPFSERMNWGHVWLVDPLNGTEAFINHNGNFSVNIALIEGGRPVWGVIYNPLSDTVYYAKGASGSFKIVGNKEPEELAPPKASDGASNTVILSGKNEAPEDIKKYIEAKNKDYKIKFADSATALCLLAEEKVTLHINMEPAMEWQTAAADAIARSSGKRVYDYITDEALTYNKENLSNDRFIAE